MPREVRSAKWVEMYTTFTIPVRRAFSLRSVNELGMLLVPFHYSTTGRPRTPKRTDSIVYREGVGGPQRITR